MDFDDSPREEQKYTKKQNTDKKMGTMTKGFFEVQDIQDYVDDVTQIKRQKQKFYQKQNKQQEQDIVFTPSNVRKKRNNRNIKLQPLQKESPQIIIAVGIEQQNPQNKIQQKKKKPIIMSFSSQQEQQIIQSQTKRNLAKKQEITYKQESQNQKVQQQENHQESAKEQEQEQENLSQPSQRDIDSPFDKILRPLRPEKNLNFLIKRDKQWLNKLRPVYKVHYFRNNDYLMAGKLVSNNTTSTFLISLNQEEFVENGIGYIGKVKTNFTGNISNIFGAGLNPSDAKQKKTKPRQLLATIQYETNYFGKSRPRDFRVFVLKPQVSYYSLIGVKVGQDEIPLNELYHNHINRQKIYCYSNKKPEWNKKLNGYMLNFRGRAKKASIKNFIIQDNQRVVDQEQNQDNGEKQIMMFGKLSDDDFRMDVKYPFSPYIGFGIVLSTFGSKIGCQ